VWLEVASMALSGWRGALTLLRNLSQFGLGAALLCASARAQSVTLEVQPASISVSPSYSEVQARVILKNGSPSAISGAALSFLTNDGPLVEFGKPSATVAAPGGVIEWPVTVRNLSQARLPAAVLIDAAYSPSAAAAGSASLHLLASLAISSQPDGTLKPVEAALEGTFDAVSQQRPATGYLDVTNNLDVAIHVHVAPLVPVGTFTIPPIPDFDVPPRSAISTRFRLEVGSQITPGVYPVIFEVLAKWNWAGHEEQRHIVLSKQATAGVFFESEILKALGVPSFLMLPGCLVVFTFQLLVMLGAFGIKNESGLPQSAIASLTVTTAGFWILAITFSAPIVFFYSVATHNNILMRYGSMDLVWVWLVSILIGIVVCIAYGVVGSEWRKRHVFTTQDTPLTVLRKLAANGRGVLRPQVKFKVNTAETVGLLLEPEEDGQTRIWVAPQIVTEWGTSDQALLAQANFQASVQKGADSSSSGEIAKELEAALQSNPPQVTVRWNTLGSLPNPFHLKVELITNREDPASIVT
jgi:hypothetical protein